MLNSRVDRYKIFRKVGTVMLDGLGHNLLASIDQLNDERNQFSEPQEPGQPHIHEFLSIQAEDLNGSFAASIAADGVDTVLSKFEELCRVFDRGINEERPFVSDVVVVRFRPPVGVGQREVVALETLIAKLAAKQEVRPFVGQPVISRLNERIVGLLSKARLGPKMFDVAISDVGNL